MTKVEEAAIKAEDMMNSKYGDAWKIINKTEEGEEKIEIKDEYMAEYDHYYDIFFFN